MFQRAGPFLAGLLAGLLAAGVLYLLIAEPRGEPVRLQPPPTLEPFRIHVSGAVQQPGVYAVLPGSVVEEAVQAAGGLAPQADLNGINLAAPVLDGQLVYIPARGEATSTPLRATAPASVGPINVNTASAPELELLPGIGPTLATSIIEYRQAHGPFHSVDDLLDVPGIGPAKLGQIRDLVSVE